MSPDNKKNLSILLYFLHGISNLNDEVKYEKLSRYLHRNYSPEELESFANTIDFVVADAAFDFKTIETGLRHDNEDVVFFLGKVRSLI